MFKMMSGRVSWMKQSLRSKRDLDFSFRSSSTLREPKAHLSPLLLDYLICKLNIKSIQPDKNLTFVLTAAMLLQQCKTLHHRYLEDSSSGCCG